MESGKFCEPVASKVQGQCIVKHDTQIRKLRKGITKSTFCFVQNVNRMKPVDDCTVPFIHTFGKFYGGH